MRIAIAFMSASLVGTAAPLAAQARPAATEPPRLGAQRPLVLPSMVERTLPNGLRLVVVEQHELPIVDATLVIKSGSESDPEGKKGLATLTANLLDEGAGSRDALALADEMGFLAVQIGTSATFDRSSVSLHSSRATLDSAMKLMADIVLRPSFSEKDFARIRSERLTALLQESDRGPVLADRAFAAIVYGEKHPYGHSTSGTTDAVESITRDDVMNFWKTRYRPNNATLVIVGDVTPAEAEQRARAFFGAWERAPVPAVVAGSPTAPSKSTIYIVDKPKAAQTSFRIGSVGVARSTKDYYPLMVMNTALGGSFTSRLNQNLRETKGYTYGAGSSFAMRRTAGPFLASAEVVAAKTDSALIEFMKEIRNIGQPVPASELAKTKRYLQLGYAARFESTGDIAGQVASLVPYDLPLSTLGMFNSGIGAVTTTEVQRVAKQYVDPSKLAIVVAGDRASIEAALKATGIAPVEIRDALGRRIIVP
ncbi:MAG TPA: pitrilysin family protein [Gemmatimonas sp.]|nr:pitrilysin family protein [Gemmatimonas sp.]